MRVYHGSTFIVTKPDLKILNYRTDFGKGFYTTTDIEQAKKWTDIKKKRMQNNTNEIILFIIYFLVKIEFLLTLNLSPLLKANSFILQLY